MRWIFWFCLLLTVGSFIVAAVLAEAAMHPPVTHHASDAGMIVHDIEQSTGSVARQVSLTAKDGTQLKGWWLLPPKATDRAVIVCHGVGDTAMGSLGFSWLFLSHGYAVLAPESRAHGESGGVNTFGVLEAGDIVEWAQWVKGQGQTSVYGLGESLGGAILLQSLARGAELRAVIAESAYATLTEVADDRIGERVWPPLARLLIREAFVYAGLRYRVNLFSASPLNAVGATKVPVLLIHGEADSETLPKHSEQIARSNPAIRLWRVPGAHHTGAYAAAPREFESRVLDWFAAH